MNEKLLLLDISIEVGEIISNELKNIENMTDKEVSFAQGSLHTGLLIRALIKKRLELLEKQ